MGAGNRGVDAVTLLIAIPLLASTLIGHRRRSPAGSMLFLGAVTWFVYVYATLAVGAAFNALFVVYVVVFSASLWALMLAFSAVRSEIVTRDVSMLPRLGSGWLLVISGLFTAAAVVGPRCDHTVFGRRTRPPRRQHHYGHTCHRPTVIAPAALVAGVLILRRRAVGYVLAAPLLTLEAMLAPSIAAQTVSQLTAGVILTPGEIIGPVAAFLVLAAVADWFQFRILGRIGWSQQPPLSAG